MSIVVRFAPSPTGFLHIGGARTALFNWLFARHHQGRFLLRIEDTDRARSTEAAIAAILDGLTWLGLEWDGETVLQFSRAARHAEVARALVAAGGAYYCFATPEELAEMRAAAEHDGRPARYDGRWRERDPKAAPAGVKPVIRFKAPRDGETMLADLVQGEIRVANDQLDDMVLLRADGTPTYMLSVVVDDHDMAITHVLRGHDHLTNAFRQIQLFKSLDWPIPHYGHIPLIHGADGAKLSKRHGALGVEAYRDLGILPEAMFNYLLRLGWSHGDDEIIGRAQAIEWFDVDHIGRSPARFDMTKLQSVNAHYLKLAPDARLVDLMTPFLAKLPGCRLDTAAKERLRAGMAGLKSRAKTLDELARAGAFYARARPIALEPPAAKLLDPAAKSRLTALRGALGDLAEWRTSALEDAARELAAKSSLKLGELAQPLRAALTGSNASPGIFEVAEVLGREETLGRIVDVLS